MGGVPRQNSTREPFRPSNGRSAIRHSSFNIELSQYRRPRLVNDPIPDHSVQHGWVDDYIGN